MTQWAVVAGRTVADILTNLLSIAVMVVVGLIVGFSFTSPVGDVLLGVLAVMFGRVLRGVRLGRPGVAVARDRERVRVHRDLPADLRLVRVRALESMPAGIQWFAEINPFSTVVDALRALWIDGPAGNDGLGGVRVVDRDRPRVRGDHRAYVQPRGAVALAQAGAGSERSAAALDASSAASVSSAIDPSIPSAIAATSSIAS